ncbi:MAG: MATE family efflux transporter [Planctomycetes bacterium]|jgi:multidrug resistance protein, MATE family|nr:MATE family efflux transporter [Planctomycetota bacterium]MBT4028689.1 MATE family efflux transporter [Planctomycetota bacterium]MBT4560097.1 MATE family efflux transporter [Planctomycetota bacterium]MBT7012600.1 MATE family efflux transporter [Planctomycetota bacterium]MBT7319133.1 MATE family efflux transporter [Planctomycetota bacterium]
MPSKTPADGSKMAVLRIAWPIGVSMVSYTLKGFVDMLMVGHLGLEALAGVGLAGILAWNITAFPWGALRGQRPLVSQYLGAGDTTAALSFGVHAFYFATMASALFVVFASQLGQFGQWVGETSNISPESAIIAGEYLGLRMLWAAPMLLAMAVAEYLRSTERPRIPMAADLLSHPLNVAFNYVLIFGKFGIPAMGVRGAAIGTGLADLCAMTVMFWLARPKRGQWAQLSQEHPLRFRWSRMKRVFETGWTGGFQFMIEGGAFALITYFVGFLGTASLAIHQAAIQLVHMSIMPAVAVADGGSVLIGKYVGELRWEQVRKTVRSVLQLILPFMCLMGVVFVVWGEELMGLFLKDSDPIVHAKAIEMGGMVAIAVAAWQFGDAFQITYRFCLRATGDHKWVMWAGILVSWLLNVPIIAATIFWFNGDVFHAWMAFTAEIYIGGWIFHRRWRSGVWKSKRLVSDESGVEHSSLVSESE